MGKQFSCDFETTTLKNDCRVWVWGACSVEDINNFKYDTTMESFIEWCKSNGNSVCYFHNLKFDGNFIIHYLLNNDYVYSKEKISNSFNTIISSTGQFYQIEVIFDKRKKAYKKVIFKDSLKKLPFPVKKIAKDFGYNIQKLEIDYESYRPLGYVPTNEEIEYLKHDVQIVALALQSQFEQGLTKMTNGSDALSDFKEIIGENVFKTRFPVLDIDIDKDIRLAYRGGFTYVNPKYKGKDIESGIVFDVNSLYPSVMYNEVLPYDYPLYFTGQYKEDKMYPLYICHVVAEFKLKKDKIPTIQIKNNFAYVSTEYIVESTELTELYLTNVDLQLFLENYDILYINYINGWKFKGAKGLFQDYIDKWTEVKVNNTGAVRSWAKLMLNSLYGKFATNPDVTGKHPYLDENNIVRYKLNEKELKDPIYTAIGVFVTSYARHKTISTAQQLYERFIYADTDSVHLVGTDIPTNIDIHESKLGYWKHESTFTRARFLRAKTYIEEIDGTLNVKCAGMTDIIKEQVTWENFHVGFSSNDKLKPTNVVGGVILEKTDFTIK